MRVHVKLFGEFREAAGTDTVTLDLPEDADCLRALKTLSQGYPRLGSLIFSGGELRDHLHVFLNGQNVNNLQGLATRLSEGDVLTFFLPISGG
ncbi:MAG: ubiquitin-like small modifier protein 1 [Candidatus Bipolaricaulaceae bacterium]